MQSTTQVESRQATKKTWHEPVILVERSLSVSAGGPKPGPGFGPLLFTPTSSAP